MKCMTIRVECHSTCEVDLCPGYGESGKMLGAVVLWFWQPVMQCLINDPALSHTMPCQTTKTPDAVGFMSVANPFLSRSGLACSTLHNSFRLLYHPIQLF